MSDEREQTLSQAKLDLIYDDARRLRQEKAIAERIEFLKKEVPAQVERCLTNARACAESGRCVAWWRIPDNDVRQRVIEDLIRSDYRVDEYLTSDHVVTIRFLEKKPVEASVTHMKTRRVAIFPCCF